MIESNEPGATELRDLVEGSLMRSNAEAVTLMCYAASQNDVAELRRILNSDEDLSPDDGDYDGRCPLHLAAANGALEVCFGYPHTRLFAPANLFLRILELGWQRSCIHCTAGSAHFFVLRTDIKQSVC